MTVKRGYFNPALFLCLKYVRSQPKGNIGWDHIEFWPTYNLLSYRK